MQSMTEHEDKIKKIKKIIAPALKQLVEQIRKISSIAAEEKHILFGEMKEIKR